MEGIDSGGERSPQQWSGQFCENAADLVYGLGLGGLPELAEDEAWPGTGELGRSSNVVAVRQSIELRRQ